MTDFPEYVIKPNAARIFISQFVITAILSIVFYLGIALNVYLLGMNIPTNVNILIAVVLVLLIIIQALLSYLQTSKTRYSVFKNRIQIDGIKQEYIMFNTIQELKHKRNLFDKIFNTGTLVLGPKNKLIAIPNFEATLNYLNQIIQYSRTQFNQF